MEMSNIEQRQLFEYPGCKTTARSSDDSIATAVWEHDELFIQGVSPGECVIYVDRVSDEGEVLITDMKIPIKIVESLHTPLISIEENHGVTT